MSLANVEHFDRDAVLKTLNLNPSDPHTQALLLICQRYGLVYRGRHPKSGSNKQYGPEMAVKCAEVMALRRAFNVTGVGAADERWDADTHERIDPALAADLAERLNRLGGDARKTFFAHFGNRRPQDLRADDEAEAVVFTEDLEAVAEAAEVFDAEVVDEADAEPEPLPDNGKKAHDEALRKLQPKAREADS